MDIKRAIKLIESADWNGHGEFFPDVVQAREMAIKALQKQAEREKGCEYCNGDALDGLVLTKFCDMPKIALRGGNCPPYEDEKPTFCPHCGRRLK